MMHTATYAAPLPQPNIRAGTILTALPVLFLVFDSVIKLVVIQPVVDSFIQLGWPVHLSVAIGALELVCLALYLLPRTAPFGALLLTAYLGGAVATHARVESPLLTHTLFPVYVAVLLWIGLLLRQPRLRELLARASAPAGPTPPPRRGGGATSTVPRRLPGERTHPGDRRTAQDRDEE